MIEMVPKRAGIDGEEFVAGKVFNLCEETKLRQREVQWTAEDAPSGSESMLCACRPSLGGLYLYSADQTSRPTDSSRAINHKELSIHNCSTARGISIIRPAKLSPCECGFTVLYKRKFTTLSSL